MRWGLAFILLFLGMAEPVWAADSNHPPRQNGGCAAHRDSVRPVSESKVSSPLSITQESTENSHSDGCCDSGETCGMPCCRLYSSSPSIALVWFESSNAAADPYIVALKSLAFTPPKRPPIVTLA